ncbi:hypothetical protein FA95DRAFT_1617662, partial [Auriscalpium vulgare]
SLCVSESAGATTSASPDPSIPFAPLQSDANFDWNADTGATSHMTPHWHWLRTFRLPI